ncbi:MAG: ComF family protein [bacterium]
MAIEIHGNWKKGYALDLHTQSSEYLGVDETGRDRFDTTRTKIGELVYRLKYRSDLTVIPDIINYILEIKGIQKAGCIIPVPPSNINRQLQPVFVVGHELSKETRVPFFQDAILKTKSTPQLKEIEDLSERERILADAFEINKNYNFSGMNVLVIDDLYRSGTTLKVITSILYNKARVKNVYVIALTKTRSRC